MDAGLGPSGTGSNWYVDRAGPGKARLIDLGRLPQTAVNVPRHDAITSKLRL